jgi:hypothetical protein
MSSIIKSSKPPNETQPTPNSSEGNVKKQQRQSRKFKSKMRKQSQKFLKQGRRKVSYFVDHDDAFHDPIHKSLTLKFPPTMTPHINKPVIPRLPGHPKLHIPHRSRGTTVSVTICSSRKILVDITESNSGSRGIVSANSLTDPPFPLGFLACAAGDGFFVFGLVEITFGAFGTAGPGVNPEVFAKVLVAFRFFELVII